MSSYPRNSASKHLFLFAACSSAVVALLWLPFGFNMLGHIEEWDLLSLFTRHGLFYVVDADGPLPTHRMRPLMLLPNALAHLITPDSFFAMHLLQMLGLMLKGVVGGLMGYWLVRSRIWAVLLAVLVIVYPADTMQLSFRSFHINWSVALAMAGVMGIVYAYDEEHSRGKIATVMLAAASTAVFAIATLIYELAIAYAILPLFFLWYRRGLVEMVRLPLRRWPVSLMWCAGVLGCAAYLYSVVQHGSTYQGEVLKGQAASMDMLLNRAHTMFYTGIGRSVAGGWIDAARILYIEYDSYWYLLVIAVLAGSVLNRLRDSAPASSGAANIRASQAFRLLLLGVAIAAVGYLPFVASPSHTAISQRTFLFATPGGALTTVAIIMLIASFNRKLAPILGALAVGLGMAAQMYQFHHYEQLSDTERQVLTGVAASLPDIATDHDVLILDGSHHINSVWMLRDNMMHALTYLYGKPVNLVQICNQPEGDWERLDDRGRTGRCVEQADRWEFTTGGAIDGPGYGLHPERVIYQTPKSTAQVVTIPQSGVVPMSPTRREELSTRNDAVSRRYRAMLTPSRWPLAFDQFHHTEQDATYRWDFGRWWSLDLPAPGRGWQDIQWQPEGRAQQASFSWNVVENPWLGFDMKPTHDPYIVRGKVKAFAPGIQPDRLAISVNETTVPLRWINPTEFYAELPATTLRDGANKVTFILPVDRNYFGIGLALDWVRFAPAPAERH